MNILNKGVKQSHIVAFMPIPVLHVQFDILVQF